MIWRRCLALALCALLLPLQAFMLQGPVYEVFVASYADGDGDGRGDLRGLSEKLPYLQSLKVDGLWLMPISPSPSYHKYDVTDYLAVDPAYGTLADFEALAARCDGLRISLILDLVLNHSSSQHPWFLAACQSLRDGTGSPYRDFYLFSQTAGHPVPEAPGWYYAGSFGPHMPELNLDSSALRGEIREILRFWITRGADGFRLDAVSKFHEENAVRNADFLTWLRESLQAIQPDVYLVGEVWKDANSILSHYGSGIDSLFNFPFADATGILVDAIRNQRGRGLAEKVAAWNKQLHDKDPLARDAPFLSNHDMGRSAGFLMYKQDKMKLAAALYLTLPGIPFLYYGEEIGMSGSGRDENKRLPMLWTADPALLPLPPADADQTQRLKAGVDLQEKDPNSLLSFYRALLTIRAAFPWFSRAEAEAVDTGQTTVAAWRLHDATREALILHNLSDKSVTLALPAGGQLITWDTGSGVATSTGQELLLPPLGGCIIGP
ncbi:MAG: alpha-amylase family glycosyl hydrolase [Christensenellales bacterium]